MTTTVDSKSITSLLNGVNTALKNVVPVEAKISKPILQKDLLHVTYGVFVGMTGDIRGKILFIGEKDVFSSIGERMFSVPIEEEMLSSFSGELGNMIVGNVSSYVEKEGLQIDITSPSIITGNAEIQGHHLGIQLTSSFIDLGDLYIHLLLDR